MLQLVAERDDTTIRLLLKSEGELPGEWENLERFGSVNSQPPPTEKQIRRSLQRRLLVTDEGESWRLRASLMSVWLHQQG